MRRAINLFWIFDKHRKGVIIVSNQAFKECCCFQCVFSAVCLKILTIGGFEYFLLAIINAELVMRDHLIPDGYILIENGLIKDYG